MSTIRSYFLRGFATTTQRTDLSALWHNVISLSTRIADIIEVHIFKASVHNLTAIVMVHLFNGSVLILMTRGQMGFEGYSVCYVLCF
jgi:hypothetical protein